MTRFQVIIITYLLGFLTPAYFHATGLWGVLWIVCALIVFIVWCLCRISSVQARREDEEGEF